MAADEKQGTVADIADAHLKQKGSVSFGLKDGRAFIFTTKTLEYLLEKARANPEQKAMVFIPNSELGS